ncbi:sulfurtransferase [Pseudomonas sp. Hp2]|uniref:sulfurtransferase n=1 Tax=Pseudomonas sp. Hp2 TaxID=701189 RepID=UPI00112CA3A1|nr:rhodanese-like domain-containing protein [Pseudomonas sp. Hp2]
MSAQVSPLIDAATLAARLGEPRLRVLDASVELPAARFDGDYRPASGLAGWRAAHIPGSRHADLLEALADKRAGFGFALPDWPVLATALQRLGIGDDSAVVVYDRSDGFWAARLWWMLRSLGLHARVLDGGWQAWRAAGWPEESGDAADIEPGTITLRPRPELWADRRHVEAVVAGRAPGTLVCALPAPLFAGSAPTRYARRGHIPGSLNLPARDLFGADGRYLPVHRLEQLLAPLRASARPLLPYCGGGISAAAQALALTLVGETDIALYDGSLQEWAADPSLPLVVDEAPSRAAAPGVPTDEGCPVGGVSTPTGSTDKARRG